MRETRTSGSVRGASGNGRPYRERCSAGFILGGDDRFPLLFGLSDPHPSFRKGRYVERSGICGAHGLPMVV
jgi:hypothetical protein